MKDDSLSLMKIGWDSDSLVKNDDGVVPKEGGELRRSTTKGD